METLFDTSYVIMNYEPEYKLLSITWKSGNFTSEQYREVFEKAVIFGNNNPVDNYLSDIIEQKIVSPADRKWFESEAIPKAMATGLKRAGIILGANPFKRYYFNNIMAKTGKFKLPFKAFKNKDDALTWFKSF